MTIYNCRTAMMWAPEGCWRQGRLRTTWRSTAEERERAGWRNWRGLSTAVADRAE